MRLLIHVPIVTAPLSPSNNNTRLPAGAVSDREHVFTTKAQRHEEKTERLSLCLRVFVVDMQKPVRGRDSHYSTGQGKSCGKVVDEMLMKAQRIVVIECLTPKI